jgi:hypothetical protein
MLALEVRSVLFCILSFDNTVFWFYDQGEQRMKPEEGSVPAEMLSIRRWEPEERRIVSPN